LDGREAEASESIRLAIETGQENLLGFCLICLANLDAVRGREPDCKAHAGRTHEIAGRLGIDSLITYADAVQGLLELGLGRPAEAVRALENVDRRVRRHGLAEPGVILWRSDLIEAYTQVGRTNEAREALATFEHEAQTTGRTWALACTARCRGLLADDESFEREFANAFEWHDRTPTPFERARTELRLGERRRRARRLADAREPLRSALETFDRLGADPWAEHASAELRATGEAVARRATPASLKLTPQELEVALAVSKGATNREAAAALFVTPKTIEFHLHNVYRKLGLRSRAQLAWVFALDGMPDAQLDTVPVAT